MGASRGGVINIELRSGNAALLRAMSEGGASVRKFGSDVDGVKNKFGEFGSHGVSNLQAISGGLRVVEGGITGNLRAAERFLASIPGIGKAFQAIFPIVGSVAIAEIFIRGAEEAKKFYDELRKAPETLAGGMRALSAQASATNDEMELTNVKLQNQIALLEGKRQNTLKEAIFEARVEADKLGESLENDLKKLYDFLENNKPSGTSRVMDAAIGGIPPELSGKFLELQRSLGGYGGEGGSAARIRGYEETARNEFTRAAQMPMGTPDEKKAANLVRTNAQQTLTNALTKEYGGDLKLVNDMLKEFTAIQEQQWASQRFRKIMEETKPKVSGTEGAEEFKSRTAAAEAASGLKPSTQGLAVTGNLGPMIEALQYARDTLTAKQATPAIAAQTGDLKEHLKTDENLEKGAKSVEAYTKKIAELKEKVEAAKIALGAAGVDDSGVQMFAKAEEEAQKAFLTVNDEIRKQNESLGKQKEKVAQINTEKGAGDARAETIRGLALDEQRLVFQTELTKKVAEASNSIRDQVKQQEMLTAAIGQGWEAQKKASVEIELMTKLKPEEYNDKSAAAAAARDKLRGEIAVAIEAKHQDEIAKTNKELGDQITLEQRLAQVQVQGAYAVEYATLQVNIAHLKEQGLLGEVTKTVEKFYAEQANRSAVEIGNITREIAALDNLIAAYAKGHEAVRSAELENKLAADRAAHGTIPGTVGISPGTNSIIEKDQKTRDEANAKDLLSLQDQQAAVERLMAARLRGVEAVRQAEIENKAAQMKASGASGEDIAQMRTNAELENQDKITEAVMKRLAPYDEELDKLNKERAYLLEMRAALGDQADIMRAIRDEEDARLKIAVQQELAERNAMAGVRAFFLEMEEQAKSSASIIYETLNSAVDKVSDNLTKAMTGQKTAWAAMFKSLGEEELKSSVKSGLQTGIGAVGKALGITPTTKRDGQSASSALWVQMVGAEGGMAGTSVNAGGLGKLPISSGNILFGNGGLMGTGQVPQGPGGSSQTAASSPGIMTTILKGLASVFTGAGKSSGGGGSQNVGITDMFPAMASGGDVTAGQTYLTGEQGPELFRANASGHISNAAQTRQAMAGGGDHYYTIDARGTDPNLTGQRVEAAIRAAHQSAVGLSVRAIHEQQARTVRGG